jgi:plastocyanin
MRTVRAALPVLVFALALTAAACGGDDSSDDGGTGTTAAAPTTTASTAAPTTTKAPTTTAAPTTTEGGGGTTAEPPDGPIELVIEAEDNEGFNLTRLEAPVFSEVTVTFINKDVASGEPHNWHLRTDTGDYFTPVTNGPDTNSVTFTVATAGEFDYFCDTHLTAMKGVFVATP